jgi:hypothetical protein
MKIIKLIGSRVRIPSRPPFRFPPFKQINIENDPSFGTQMVSKNKPSQMRGPFLVKM